jgi:hypothetical protein
LKEPLEFLLEVKIEIFAVTHVECPCSTIKKTGSHLHLGIDVETAALPVGLDGEIRH